MNSNQIEIFRIDHWMPIRGPLALRKPPMQPFAEVMIIKKANSDYNDKQLSFFENSKIICLFVKLITISLLVTEAV